MAGELDGKIAIITGAAGGIGAAAARLFVAEGARVVISDLADERGEAVAQDLGDKAIYVHADASSADDVKALVDKAVDHFGGLDIFFANAGVPGEAVSQFLDDDLSSFEKTFAVDVKGPLLAARFAGAYMRDHGGGVILSTASNSAFMAGWGLVPYRAAKAAVVSATRSLAVQLAPFNIRVNCVSPGPTRTEMTLMMDDIPADLAEKLQDISYAEMIDGQPLKRVGTGIDIANAALFLASNRAAQITGHDLIVDGGMSLGDPVDRLANIQTKIAEALGGGQ